ncbi:MAG: T9SS type A sorting domain-containing protein [Phaeodactylibacter sp.]|nr:T9SS type A sorting domain-containing protein [Phaeodactylibacter sp.]
MVFGQAEDWSIYPNPAGSELQVSISNPSVEGVQIQVMDMMGRTVYTRKYDKDTYTARIELWLSPVFRTNS